MKEEKKTSAEQLKVRMGQLCDSLGYRSRRSFVRDCGLRDDFFNKPPAELPGDAIKKIYGKVPNINLYWLIFGEGENLYLEDRDSIDFAANRFLLTEFRKLQIENRNLIAENAVLKAKLDELDPLSEDSEEG